MVRGAVWVANEPVPLIRLDRGEDAIGDPRFRSFWADLEPSPFVPPVLWKLGGSPPGTPVSGVRDDNRSALLPDRRFVIRGKEFLAAVKGCGAAVDAYENVPLTSDRARTIARDAALAASPLLADGATPGFVTGERWFGNTPYGGQAPDNAAIGFLTSLRAKDAAINGFSICPIVALVRLPDALARIASSFFWYRRYEGEYWQEVRLMPSNVRLYFHSPVTFGVDTSRALSLFGITSFEDAERFLENLARSALAALTLYARTLRHDGRGGYAGLAYHDVWLDKDAVIAPDGTMHFADLEGIEEVRAEDPASVREEVGRQFHRNVYEATYALEALAWDVDRRWRAFRTPAERRRWILEVLERACVADPFVAVDRRGERLLVTVEPAVDASACRVEIELASGVVT